LKCLIGDYDAARAIGETLIRDDRLNVGVILPNGWVCADIDSQIGAVALGSLLELRTPLVATYRGVHVYLGGSHATRKTAWGEILAHHRYVVAPPSIHETGHRYAPLWWPDGGLASVESGLAAISQIFDRPLTVGQRVVNSRPLASRRGPPVVEYSRLEDRLPDWKAGLPPDGIRNLDSWDRREFFVNAACEVLGIPIQPIGTPFLCVLPGHAERRPSASLYPDRHGRVVYHDFHAPGGAPEFLPLAMVYAAQKTGTVAKLNPSTLAAWKRRFLTELGLVAPAPVQIPALPPGEPPRVHKIYDGFRQLLQCRWLTDPGQPAPFTREFAAGWCGLSERHAGIAIQRLIELRLIRRVPTPPNGGLAHFYMPGATSATGQASALQIAERSSR
jgi:Bifunctional DNA primase/polymerase, N-terminal